MKLDSEDESGCEMGLGGDEEGEERRGGKESGWTEMKGERGGWRWVEMEMMSEVENGIST